MKIIGIVLLGLAIAYFCDSPDEAMAQCQKTHSYSTCFYGLNR